MDEVESMRRKLGRPIPLRGAERWLYAAVLLSIALGITWSVVARDWQYFERSGSLVILVAVWMAWRDHVQLLGRVENFYRGEFNQLLAEFDRRRPTGLIATVAHEESRKEIEASGSNLSELIATLKRRLRTTEVLTLCLGTFVWGYGSPIAKFLWHFQ